MATFAFVEVNKVVEEPLFPGTAKSAERNLVGKLFQQARKEGCQVSVHWQDSDSSSARPSQKCANQFPSGIVQGMLGRFTPIDRLSEAKKSFIHKDIQGPPHCQAFLRHFSQLLLCKV